MDRTERFYKIQTMLMAQPSVTMRQMLGTLEVSRATLNRDLAICAIGLGSRLLGTQVYAAMR